jgi:hypothetical protein
MILYVNGDSHTAGAEAVNTCSFSDDDHQYKYLGRSPHPDNLAVSWGKKLSELVKMSFYCNAESGASNYRIERTTRKWIEDYTGEVKDIFVIIGWSTWEREEWLIDDVYYQVNASGVDTVPSDYVNKYKEYVVNVNWIEKTKEWHDKIWELHIWLEEQNIKHVFFNCNNDLNKIKEKKDWGVTYIDPYTWQEGTYDVYLKTRGHHPVSGYHYDATGHADWAKFLLKYIVKNNLL